MRQSASKIVFVRVLKVLWMVHELHVISSLVWMPTDIKFIQIHVIIIFLLNNIYSWWRHILLLLELLFRQYSVLIWRQPPIMRVWIILGRRTKILHLIIEFSHVIWHCVIILANYNRLIITAIPAQIPDSTGPILLAPSERPKPWVETWLELIDNPAVDSARVRPNTLHVLVLVRLVRVLIFKRSVVSKIGKIIIHKN